MNDRYSKPAEPRLESSLFVTQQSGSSLFLAVMMILFSSVDQVFRNRITIESVLETGEGTPLRQIVYVSVFLLVAIHVGRFADRARLRAAFPATLFVLFLWCALSLGWSPVPGIGGRRLILTGLVAATVLFLAQTLRPEHLIAQCYRVVVALALISLAGALLIPELAIHQPGDPEISIIGEWRGLFYHKNIFGAVMALGLILSGHFLGQRRSLGRWAAFGLMAVLLWLSGSKTSLGMAVLALVVMAVIARAQRRVGGGMVLVALLLILTSLCLAVVLAATLEGAAPFAISDEFFTGRGLIWRSLLQLAEGHRWLGLGYQSVFQVGQDSALAQLSSVRYLVTVPHAHSTYIEMLVSIGIIGLSLFVLAIIAAPIRALVRMHPDHAPLRPVLMAILFFVWTHGLLEVGLLDRDRTSWVIFLVAYGAARAARFPRTSP